MTQRKPEGYGNYGDDPHLVSYKPIKSSPITEYIGRRVPKQMFLDFKGFIIVHDIQQVSFNNGERHIIGHTFYFSDGSIWEYDVGWIDNNPAWDGKRKDNDKLKMGLVPPEWIIEISRVWHYGAIKYNYTRHANAPYFKNPMEWTRVLNSCFRHIFAFLCGERFDKETKCHHLAMAAWNILILMTYDMHGMGEDDLERDFWIGQLSAEDQTNE